MNQDPSQLANDLSQQTVSLNNSPTKPLKFPNPTQLSQAEKEFNSSSDTYTSDPELDQNLIPSSISRDTVESSIDLLNANFENDDIQSTILINQSEFTFVGSKSPEVHPTIPEEPNYVNSSPSKSIMKKIPSMSPKKNVAFTNSTPEVHHYTFDGSKTASSDDDSESDIIHQEQLLSHQWNQLEKISSSSSDNESSTPPVPPPHNITNTFQKIFDDKAQTHDSDHIDQQTLNELKLNHKNFSNLSLNEKLDIYLSNKDHNQELNKKSPEELDEHLTNLQNSMKHQTDSHIHDLSLHLQQQNNVENPLDSLAKSSEVELRSSGSSQSSLQSLGDNNRALYSENDNHSGNQGITLNDGILGFPDHLVQNLIPSTKDSEYLFIGAGKKSLKTESESEDDIYHDSFDQSYNNTEKSIMNLLNSTSNLNLPDYTEKSHNDNQSERSVKTEILETSNVQAKPTEETIVKPEPVNNIAPVQPTETIVKPEPVDNIAPVQPTKETSVKSEPVESISQVKPEPEYHDHTPFVKPEPQDSIDKSEPIVDNQEIKVKLEPIEGVAEKPAVEEEVSVTSEPQDELEDESYEIKKEPLEAFETTDSFQNMFNESFDSNKDKSDSNDFDANEYEADSKIESVSYIISLDAKDVKLILRSQSSQTLKQISPSDSAETVQTHDVKREAPESNHEADISTSSNDGDKEDNDDITEHELSTAHHHKRQLEVDDNKDVVLRDIVSKEDQSKEDSVNISDEFVGKSLAPPRIDEAIDATVIPSPIKRALEAKAAKAAKENQDTSEIREADQSILANSSNIAPQERVILAPPDTNTSFDDYSRQFDLKDSFEESLSAEHEVDPKPVDFISIWHSQEKKKKLYVNQDLNKYKQIPSSEYHYESNGKKNYKIPTSLQPKVFKEVNVMSRRVVSSGFEDLNVSGFLPELSQDSGFGNQFNGLVKNTDTTMNLSNYSNVSGNRRSMTPLSTKNVLSNIDNDPSIIEPPAPKPISKRHTLAPDYASRYRQIHSQENKENEVSQPKRSQFKVPSFEIKRSNSVLSPRNQYNDIFDISEPPTIKSHGMKTLPSMDGDDVKKILEAKRGISQQEYSRVKLKANEKKGQVVLESSDKYDSLQQHASIYDASVDSTPNKESNHTRDRDIFMPHIRTELMKNPTALLTKEQLFNDSSVYLDDSYHPTAPNANNSDISGLSSILNEAYKHSAKNIESIGFPEPDPEFIVAPEKDSNIFKTPPSVTGPNDSIDKISSDPDLAFKYKIINSPRKPVQGPKLDGTPKKAGSPIKIGSPIKLVKHGSSVTGIKLDTSPVKVKQENEIKTPVSATNPFRNDELFNAKVRDQNNTNQPKNDQPRLPSTVSVPSEHTHFTQPSLASSATLNPDMSHFRQELRPQNTAAASASSGQRNASVTSPERGKLFFRVVGFKNIDLSDLKSRGAHFSISLDNGVHCIKTPNYKLDANSISIGKEFELTVVDSLEFILTMKISYNKPREKLVEVRERKVVKSKNRISRMFGSKDIITTTKFVPQEVEDAWANKFAQDGSFARCYIDLDQYKKQITGRAANFNLTCFNEWETKFDKSKDQMVKLKPSRIGQLEVKMLYVPRTDAHEVFPTSIKAAQESIDDLLKEANFNYEGYLHQEGGDCETWKRRFFKLHGTSLIAHSEYSHKTRAKINLAKVIEIIYVDKENFQKSPQNYRNFSDILLVENSFKIKFANGEMIDFGAPNKKEKDIWISNIEKIVYRNKFRRQPWVKLMIEDQYNTAMNRTSESGLP